MLTVSGAAVVKQQLKTLTKAVLKKFNIAVIKDSTYKRYFENMGALEASERDKIEVLLALPNHQASQQLKVFRKSKSQGGQDLFVLSELEFKRNGFFIEFGATDGVSFSNTYLLEKEFGWTGILAEPARCFHEDLRSNRRDCHIETDCVWRESNLTLAFNEAATGSFSTIDSFSSVDMWKKERKKSSTVYDVKTISLLDLLRKYHAPNRIDYLSIDTEGSEFEILRGFDFDQYQFNVITCEHNYTKQRDTIFSLLTQKGYTRKWQELSLFDDWYVKAG